MKRNKNVNSVLPNIFNKIKNISMNNIKNMSMQIEKKYNYEKMHGLKRKEKKMQIKMQQN